MQYITFANESPLAINIETWQPMFAGFMSEMKLQLVRPGERVVMGSETGEWYMNTYFCDKELSDEWERAGYRAGDVIGKFREQPYMSKPGGGNSWFCNEDFMVVNKNGVVTFYKK